MRYHQTQGYFRLYTTQLRERLKIIRIAKHPAYSDSRFSRQLAYLRILILRKAKSRKAETNRALSSSPGPVFHCQAAIEHLESFYFKKEAHGILDTQILRSYAPGYTTLCYGDSDWLNM